MRFIKKIYSIWALALIAQVSSFVVAQSKPEPCMINESFSLAKHKPEKIAQCIEEQYNKSLNSSGTVLYDSKDINMFFVKGVRLPDVNKNLSSFGKRLYADCFEYRGGPILAFSEDKSDSTDETVRRYVFGSAVVLTDKKGIFEIHCYDSKYEAAKGVKVGMAITEVVAKFPGLKLTNEKEGDVLISNKGCLTLHYTDGIVRWMVVARGCY